MSETQYVSEWIERDPQGRCVRIEVEKDGQKDIVFLPYVEYEGKYYVWNSLTSTHRLRGTSYSFQSSKIEFLFPEAEENRSLTKTTGVIITANLDENLANIVEHVFSRQYSADNVLFYELFYLTTTTIPFTNTDLHGNIPSPHNLAEFAEVISWVTSARQSLLPWRGMANIRWKILSGAERRFNSDPEKYELISEDTLETILRWQEEDLIQDARKQGYGFKDGRKLNDLELLSSLQHYGATTRLIDFTTNVWVALWFAAKDKALDMGVVIVNQQGISRLTSEDLPIEQILSSRENHDYSFSPQSLFWHPSYLYERMRVQHSVFMLGNHVNYDNYIDDPDPSRWCSFVKDNHRTESWTARNFLAIAIPPELKKDMANKWEPLFGFNNRTMFPDLSGFAQYWSYTPPPTKTDKNSS